jgi:hypothetical protein
VGRPFNGAGAVVQPGARPAVGLSIPASNPFGLSLPTLPAANILMPNIGANLALAASVMAPQVAPVVSVATNND